MLLFLMSVPFDPETGRATGSARQVSLEPVREPAISPDGRWIAYGTYIGRGHLKVIPSNGGAVRTLFDRENTSARDPLWSADSRQVYFRTRGLDAGIRRLMRVGVEGGEAEEVSVILERDQIGAWPPDASHRIRLLEEESIPVSMLELTDTLDQPLGRVPLHRNMTLEFPVGFTPDGMGLTAVVRELVAPIFVAPLSGGPARQISDVRTYERALGWTPDNRQVFYRTRLNGREAVLRTPLDGSPTLEIPLPTEVGDAVVPSADGRYLAYALGESADTGRTVMVRRISDGETRVLTDHYVLGLRPGREVLGPGGGVTDGDEFLYLTRDGDRWELRASPPEGPSRLVRTITDTAWIIQGGPNSGFGIHGDWVARAYNMGDSAQLILSTAPGEEHALVTVPGGLDKVYWSYDRRWIVTGHVTFHDVGFDFDLLLVELTPEGTLASEPRYLETDAWVSHEIRWLPDNQTIAVSGLSEGGVANHLWLVPIRDEGSTVEVPLGDPSLIWSVALSPDGRQVAFSEEVPRGSSIWIVDYAEFLRERGIGGR
jgi:Tol biopolymer transport system component